MASSHDVFFLNNDIDCMLYCIVSCTDPVAVLQGHAKQLKHRLSGALVRNMESLVKLMSKGKNAFPSLPQAMVGRYTILVLSDDKWPKKVLKIQVEGVHQHGQHRKCWMDNIPCDSKYMDSNIIQDQRAEIDLTL